MERIEKKSSAATGVGIGIIMLDTTFPRIVGDVGNPDTFDFPVLYKVVKGASPERLVVEADRTLLQPFIEAGRLLINKGAGAIATSCGFLALFHQELVQALDVPVFSSSLLQVHLANSVIKRDQKVGIITARKESLTHQHLAAIEIDHYPLAIIGMEQAEEFSSVFIHGKTTLDEKKCGQEMKAVASKLIGDHPEIGAIVLECTNMGPYSQIVHEVTGGLPVFDVVTMVKYMYSTLTFK